MTRTNYHYDKQIYHFHDEIQIEDPFREQWWRSAFVANLEEVPQGYNTKTHHKLYVRNIDITGTYCFLHNNEVFQGSYCTFYMFKMTPMELWYLQSDPVPTGQQLLNFYRNMIYADPKRVFITKNLPTNSGKFWDVDPTYEQETVYQQKFDFSCNELIELDPGEVMMVMFVIGYRYEHPEENEELLMTFDMNATASIRY